MLKKQNNIVQKRTGPLWKKSAYRDTKDPCPVFDGSLWHIYGSGGSVVGENQEEWEILHATAPEITGPWTEQPGVILSGLEGKHIAAPGVVYEKGVFHMLVQTEFLDVGGTIEYLTSADGKVFYRQSTALKSIPGTHEAALYDPHQAVIKGKKYMTYSGSDFIGAKTEDSKSGGELWVGRPDIFLARSTSNTWYGPWERLGKILDHEEVIHHNQKDLSSYEWGLEGSQLIELPNGVIIMNTVCFLPHGEYGTRQRVFFAFADKVTGPYNSAGTVLAPVNGSWESGENGHAAAFMTGPDMVLFYQGRPPKLAPWRYGIAYFDIKMLERIGKSTVDYYKSLNKITAERSDKRLQKLTGKLVRTRTVASLSVYSRELRSSLRKYRP